MRSSSKETAEPLGWTKKKVYSRGSSLAYTQLCFRVYLSKHKKKAISSSVRVRPSIGNAATAKVDSELFGQVYPHYPR